VREKETLNIMSTEKGFHDAVFSGLEDVALPVVRHTLPGPTWGDLLRDLLRFFSDETRGISLDVREDFLFHQLRGRRRNACRC
jgi:hypothetical protein